MRSLTLLLCLLAACGASARDDDDTSGDGGPGGDAAPDTLAHLGGTVWAPGNALGQVPDGQEIPIADALVAASTTPALEIPQEAFCDQCQEQTGGYATRSDAKGVFDLPLPAGTYYLVIQKGQFRLEQMIQVGDREHLALTTAQTTLPSEHDPASGKWTPHIALGLGQYDDIQDVLGKMGMGMVDGNGVLVGSMLGDHIEYFQNGGRTDITSNTFESLMLDLPRMKTFHIIFAPCTGTDPYSNALFTNPAVRQNIRDYVAAGGKLYVTDWSAEWEDVAFPEFIQFASDADNTSRTCSASCAGGGNNCCNEGDGSSQFGDEYVSRSSKAVDMGLHAWLDGQYGPIYDQFDEIGRGNVNPDSFVVAGNWDRIQGLPTVPLGMDDMGNPVDETAKVWVSGDWGLGGGGGHPLTVTFEPNGCGRVLYSTYHTADISHPGLLPQERVLLYLILQIGECKAGPVIP